MFHHIPALKFEPSPGANNPEEFLLYNVRIVQWSNFGSLVDRALTSNGQQRNTDHTCMAQKFEALQQGIFPESTFHCNTVQ